MSHSNTKRLSILLGILIFMFGFLKFFQPFYGWFEIQIQKSGLPNEAILLGKLGEMAIGALFLLPWLSRSVTERRKTQVLIVASLGLIVEMLVATYVHLRPEVPSDVLPLKIKPPFIPLFVLVLAVINALAVWNQRSKNRHSEMGVAAQGRVK